MKFLVSHDPNCFSLTLKRCWKTFLKRSRKCRVHPSEEAVHQFRVASRRLLAQLRLLKAAIPGLKIGRARRLLNESRKLLGELRDTQVQRELLKRCSSKASDRGLLEEYLADRERSLRKGAGSGVKRPKLAKLEKDIERLLAQVKSEGADARAHRKMLKNVQKCTEEAFTKTARSLAAIDWSRPETIHLTRIAFKHFRYTLEALPDSLVLLGPKQKRKLSAYQDRMGRIQDLEVLARTVQQFLEVYPGQAEPMASLLRQLKTQRARAIAAFRRSSSKLSDLWPPCQPQETVGTPCRKSSDKAQGSSGSQRARKRAVAEQKDSFATGVEGAMNTGS